MSSDAEIDFRQVHDCITATRRGVMEIAAANGGRADVSLDISMKFMDLSQMLNRLEARYTEAEKHGELKPRKAASRAMPLMRMTDDVMRHPSWSEDEIFAARRCAGERREDDE